MKTSNNKISDELIIGYNEGRLTDKQKLRVEEIIENDESAFLQYARLNKSFSDIHSETFEVTPDSLKQKLMDELSIKPKNQKYSFVAKVRDYLDEITLKQPNFALASVVFIALFSVIIFQQISKKDSEQSSSNIDEINKIQITEIIESLNNLSNSYESLNAKNQEGLSVALSDTIISIKHFYG